jgi:hypothetical protein
VRSRSMRVLVALGGVVLEVLRYSLYVLLLVMGRVVVPVASLMTVGGIILFFFFLLFMREQTRWIVVGGVLAVSGIVVQVFYDAALRLVAPDDVVIVRDL